MLSNPHVYGSSRELPAIDADDLSPGVRDLVLALRAAGLHTTDSGDGSLYEAGMKCAMPFPHVFVLCPKGQGEAAAAVARQVLADNPGIIDWPASIDVMEGDAEDQDGNPVDAAGMLVAHEDRVGICERLGWEGPDMSECGVDHDHDHG